MSSDKSSDKKEKIPNPFIYSVPVRGGDFYNREKIIDSILQETVLGKVQGKVWITGQRQVGKTSLLRYIQTTQELHPQKIKLYDGRKNDYYKTAFIYVNIQACETREDFYRNLHQGLKNYFDFKLESAGDSYDDFIAALMHLYFDNKNYVVFLIDEFDAFIKNLCQADSCGNTPALFLAELNKMLEGISEFKYEPQAFGCIFAANHTFEELIKELEIDPTGSGLTMENTDLPWFTEQQIKALAKSYLKDNPVKFSPDEIAACFKMTKGYPYFVQKFFYLLYELKSSGDDQNNYLKEMKKEYGSAFVDTIKMWGGDKMPKGTWNRLSSEGLYDTSPMQANPLY